MRLAEIVAGLESYDDSLCIVVKRPWTGDAEAKLVGFTEDFRIPEELRFAGYEYFLEVSTALDEILSGPVVLSTERRLAAVIYYAEYDAFPEWLSELASKQ